MTIKKIMVDVISTVEVTINEAVFNDDFNDILFDVEDSEDHALHLATSIVNGRLGIDTSLEGYGDINNIRLKLNSDVKITDQYAVVDEGASRFEQSLFDARIIDTEV